MKARTPTVLPEDFHQDPRLLLPNFTKLPRHKSWTMLDERGNLWLCEARKDPVTGAVLVGRFSMA